MRLLGLLIFLLFFVCGCIPTVQQPQMSQEQQEQIRNMFMQRLMGGLPPQQTNVEEKENYISEDDLKVRISSIDNKATICSFEGKKMDFW